jgi:hypothetical protein
MEHFERCYVLGAVPAPNEEWITFYDLYFQMSVRLKNKKDSLALFNEFRVGTYYDFLLWWDDRMTRNDMFRRFL